MAYHHRLSGVHAAFAALLLLAALAMPGPASAGEWGRKADLPAAHSEFAVAELDGKIYVISGYEIGDVAAGAVHVYDSAADRWAPGPLLPKPAHHLTAAAVGGKIYVIGGQSLSVFGGGFLDNVWALDPAQGAWVAKAPLPRARGGGVAVALDGKIYVAGGRPPHGRDFAVYDPASDNWTVLADMPSQRNHIAGAAIAGKIWVAGGRLGPGFRSDAAGASAPVFAATPAPRSKHTTRRPAPGPPPRRCRARAAASTASRRAAVSMSGAAKAMAACSPTTRSTIRAATAGCGSPTCRRRCMA
jgi:hypothetical protein